MLSLSMIVRNEATRIEACLRSVQGFVDEAVLLDTGSGDDTAAIARRCGASVHEHPWPGDFAPARNLALAQVRGDWVLVLDADERLLPEARGELQRLMAQSDLLLINLLRFEAGAAQSPYSLVSRLFRRHPALHWSGAYHAMVDDSVSALLAREPHWRIADCPIPAIHHEGYRSEALADGRKARLLRQAMERELSLRPGDPYACAKLGALEVQEGQQARGIALLEQGLAHCAAEAQPLRYELLLHLALARGRQGETAAASERLYRQALAIPQQERLRLGARLNLAALLLQRGSLEEAEAQCRQALAAAPEVALAWYNLGLVLRRRGALAEAITAYERAIALNPASAASHQNLAVAQLMAGEINAARRSFQQAIRLLEQQGQPAAAADLERQAGALVKLDA
ncbi:MAG: tetratricopeptide repeat protein [Prochlorococcaceae cyanobacterium]